MAKNRIVRQKAAELEDDDKDLGGDVALVGSPEDNLVVVADDEQGNGDGGDTVVVDGDDSEDWDDPNKGKKNKVTAREQEGDHEEEEDDDPRTAYDEDSEGYGSERRSSRRSRRNHARRQAISARDQEIQQLRGTVATLMERFQALQNGQLGIHANSIETQLTAATQALSLADSELANAVKEGDGEKFREVQALRDEAAQRVMALRVAQQRLREMPRQPNGQPQPNGQGQQQERQQLTPQQQAAAANAERMANIFMDRNPWFDPQGTDRDSRIARQIDEELAAEGYGPHNKAFWLEFEKRCKEEGLGADYRDENEEEEDEVRPQRRAPVQRRNGGGLPPTGAVRSSSRPGRGGFSLSAVQMDLLREEGLDGDKLSKEDQAKKDRIIAKWKQGAATTRRASR